MTLRPIKPIPLVGLELSEIASRPPRFEWADPQTLLVEDEYQRQLTKRGVTLIRRIAQNFNWFHIKPPICARRDDGALCVVDGQHSAIAAASRGIAKIPVMIIDAAEVTDRAGAFVAHNTERLGITPLQLFAARVAAGNKSAKAAHRVSRAAGVEIVRVQPANGMWEVGQTMAAGSVERLVARFGEEKATRVLKTLVAAKRAPVMQHEIMAVEALQGGKLIWPHSAADLVTVIRSKTANEWKRLIIGRASWTREAGHVPLWQMIAEGWIKEARSFL
jgi:hypothetical protein